jgi:hypothetical protein
MRSFLTWLFVVDARIRLATSRARKWKNRCLLAERDRDHCLQIIERERLRVEAETKAFGASIVESERKVAK